MAVRQWVSIRSRLLGREIQDQIDLIYRLHSFNPLPAVGPGDTYPTFRVGRTLLFQSAPGCWAGRYAKAYEESYRRAKFQSAPGCWAGRYAKHQREKETTQSFNPLPAVGPGDTNNGDIAHEWVQGFNPLPAVGPGDTNRSARMRRIVYRFNPLPAVGPGDTSWRERPSLPAQCFNPLPAVGPGDTVSESTPSDFYKVSIRSRLLGREIPIPMIGSARREQFQSAPGCWAGRYVRRQRRNPGFTGFNPLPAVGPGDTFVITP